MAERPPRLRRWRLGRYSGWIGSGAGQRVAGYPPGGSSLHSRPESAKQVVGTLGRRVTTSQGGIGAMRPRRRQERIAVRDGRPSRASARSVRQQKKVPEGLEPMAAKMIAFNEDAR